MRGKRQPKKGGHPRKPSGKMPPEFIKNKFVKGKKESKEPASEC